MVPPFIAASTAIKDLADARDREAQRETNELDKLLIQKLPTDKTNGELLFTLPEAQSLHDSVCDMLADNDNIDVLTTYADVKLESVQDTEAAASASSNRLSKYANSAYDELGATSQIFNANNGSTAIIYSIRKDVQIMFAWSKQYENWINCFLRRKAKNDNVYFSIRFLPTTTIFKKEDTDIYLKTAQYGYPKALVSSALGIDTADLLQLSDYENNVLGLQNYMVPLRSSYTSSDAEKISDTSKQTTQRPTPQNVPQSEGGRPPMDDTDRSDKTTENIDSQT